MKSLKQTLDILGFKMQHYFKSNEVSSQNKLKYLLRKAKTSVKISKSILKHSKYNTKNDILISEESEFDSGDFEISNKIPDILWSQKVDTDPESDLDSFNRITLRLHLKHKPKAMAPVTRHVVCLLYVSSGYILKRVLFLLCEFVKISCQTVLDVVTIPFFSDDDISDETDDEDDDDDIDDEETAIMKSKEVKDNDEDNDDSDDDDDDDLVEAKPAKRLIRRKQKLRKSGSSRRRRERKKGLKRRRG
jgi:hypothetical protein